MSTPSARRCAGVLLVALLTAPIPGDARQALAPQIAPRDLQGRWQGSGPSGEIVVTIREDSLHFFARDDFWYEARFVLVEGTAPQQLRAQIVDSAPPVRDIGSIVLAIVSLEGGILRLAVDDGSEEAPASFDDASSVYEVSRPGLARAPFERD